MYDDRKVERLPGGKAVLAENGPLRLTIQAYSGDAGEKMDLDIAAGAAEYAFLCLEQVALDYPLLRQRHGLMTRLPDCNIARRMLASVRTVGDEDLTPMAAVAGTIADSVADWLIEAGATKAIVDNGGDIAIRLGQDASIRVGLRPRVGSSNISQLVDTNRGYSSWGINTSGMGGRSLTRGIASAVTAFAEKSSLADAAATAIANNCFIPDADIQQVPANTLDPNTDLGQLLVTLGVQEVADDTAVRALNNGYERAIQILDAGHIRGAILVVQGRWLVTPNFEKIVGAISEI